MFSFAIYIQVVLLLTGFLAAWHVQAFDYPGLVFRVNLIIMAALLKPNNL